MFYSFVWGLPEVCPVHLQINHSVKLQIFNLKRDCNNMCFN